MSDGCLLAYYFPSSETTAVVSLLSPLGDRDSPKQLIRPTPCRTYITGFYGSVDDIKSSGAKLRDKIDDIW